jgi:hypothetical protein
MSSVGALFFVYSICARKTVVDVVDCCFDEKCLLVVLPGWDSAT